MDRDKSWKEKEENVGAANFKELLRNGMNSMKDINSHDIIFPRWSGRVVQECEGES